jgi:hypothetical protein
VFRDYFCETLQNKEHDDGKLSKMFGRAFGNAFGEKSNVKMGKRGGGGTLEWIVKNGFWKVVGFPTQFGKIFNSFSFFTVRLYIGRNSCSYCDYRRVNRSSVTGGSGSS